MILTATLVFFTGAVLGLRFNVKMLAHFSILAILVWIGAGAMGLTSVMGAVVNTVISLAALQTGYFTTVVLASMGYMDHRAEEASLARATADTLEIPHSTQSQKTL